MLAVIKLAQPITTTPLVDDHSTLFYFCVCFILFVGFLFIWIYAFVTDKPPVRPNHVPWDPKKRPRNMPYGKSTPPPPRPPERPSPRTFEPNGPRRQTANDIYSEVDQARV